MIPVIMSAATVVLMVLVLVDIISADEWRIKNLNKVFWVIIVIFLPLVGSILWFAVGRQYDKPVSLGGFGDPRRAPTRQHVEPFDPISDEEAIEREIAYHENQARIRRLEAELKAKREQR